MGEKNKRDYHALLNQGEENEMDIFGYRTQGWQRACCIIGYILSFGILRLLFYWKPDWDVWANCVPCYLHEADVVLLRTTDDFKKYSRKKVKWLHLSDLDSSLTRKADHAVVADGNSIINRAIMRPELKLRMIRLQKVSYAWDNHEKQFQKVGTLEDGLSCSDIHSKLGAGLTTEEQSIRRFICGPNTIEVEVTPIWKLLVKEVFNPFYAFEACSLALWLSVGYIEYSTAIIIMSLVSIIFTVYDLRQESVKLHKLVKSNNSIMVTVCRQNGECEELESHRLVPGDIIIFTGKKLFLPCDAILLSGSCIINESMLTGESIPVMKTPLPSVDQFMPWKMASGEDYKRHILFCGTEVIQTKSADHGLVKAVVWRTGFNTAKGDLVRSILYPKPMSFKLYRDALRFLLVLTIIAILGLIYTVLVFGMQGTSASEIVIKALIMATTAVPPALSAALSTGTMYAQRRMKKHGIHCISPQRINVCGRLNLVCFDKTGTLTEDGLDLWGVSPSAGNCFLKVHKFSSGNALPLGPLLGAMASCHSLIVLDGKLQGDPLDLKMFEATNWQMEDSDTADNNGILTPSIVVKPAPNASMGSVEGIYILHQFPFSSALQRMSVITKVAGDDRLTVYMKGAPETVIRFCKLETVPSSFLDELQFYTVQGFRVIGLAYKTIEKEGCDGVTSLTREQVESDLEFLGLLILENRLKVETKPVLEELNNAQIRTVMITGDNLKTAITVAKNSGLVSGSGKVILIEANEPVGSGPACITWTLTGEQKQKEYGNHEVHISFEGSPHVKNGKEDFYFAMSGRSYQVIVQHFNTLLPKILVNGAIFARMSPGQKSSLVEEFQKLDYYVCMCGDGANDCGALKVAHAGISLSEQEASVASPFTSKTPNIECVPQLIKEGRAALVTSFCVFKYMTLYAMIQVICLLLLFWQLKILGNYQFLVQDVFVTILVCLTMSLNHAYPKLAPFRPPAQLISPPLLLSVVIHVGLSLAMQVCAFLVVQQQPWYSPAPSRTCRSVNGSTLEGPSSSSTATDVNSTTDGAPRQVNQGHENFEITTLWLLSTINCIIVAFVFSKGKPFRQPIYTNYMFSCLLGVQLAVCMFILFADMENVYALIELVCTPTQWRINLLVMLLATLAASVIVEETVIENRTLWLMLKEFFNYHSKSQYRKFIRILQKDPNWPPVNRTLYGGLTNGEETKVYCNPAYENHEKQLADIKQTKGSSGPSTVCPGSLL
ncbi:probable cation-transporting ATPase 13A4 [Rhinatrema bivittatum]|uniref:probable cation-transporting ATPase 13A4 n=1 Tax=Rhinatrema bivittatum TaxID=194408 RepID=UPI00112C1114|nr:probable cation-transporting ATPase 13A4 [Rhinatrema bivittatum]